MLVLAALALPGPLLYVYALNHERYAVVDFAESAAGATLLLVPSLLVWALVLVQRPVGRRYPATVPWAAGLAIVGAVLMAGLSAALLLAVLSIAEGIN